MNKRNIKLPGKQCWAAKAQIIVMTGDGVLTVR